MNFEKIVNLKHDTFAEIDHQICKCIMQNKSVMKKISITALAEKSYTSKSSVLRFVQKLGFSGFTEFKYMIEWEEVKNGISEYQPAEVGRFVETIIQELQRKNTKELFKLVDNSTNIFIIGTGLSQQYQAQTFQRDLLKIGVNMNILPVGIHSDLSNAVIEKLTSKDLLMVISSSGENSVIKDMLTIPLLKEVPIVSITSSERSWLEDISTMNFCVRIDGINTALQQFNSTYIHLVIDYIRIEFEKYVKEKIHQTP